jgi:hypothetical protein
LPFFVRVKKNKKKGNERRIKNALFFLLLIEHEVLKEKILGIVMKDKRGHRQDKNQ